ncbi:MAG: IclR family transcriptional regulator [Actinomycetales bacterium]
MSERRGLESAPAAEHRTVARVMSILELVVANDPDGMRLGQLAEAIDAPKSSVHGLAKGLVATGYFREEDGRYLLGPAISSVLAVGPSAVRTICRPALEYLAREWNETAMLASLVGESVVYLDAVQAEAFIRAAPQINRRMTIWPRSSGRCFLAHMESRKLEAFLKRNKDAPQDTPELRAELAQIRENNFAINTDVSNADRLGIASPIRFGNRPVTFAIALAGPRDRMERRIDEITRSVVEAAEAISTGAEVSGDRKRSRAR